MKQVEDLFNEAILHWRDAKGVGTALIPKSLNDKLLVLGVLQRVLARSPTKSVAIITNTYNERLDLIDFITTQEDEENNKEFKHFIAIKVLKIVTSNLVDSIGGMITPPNLVILYHIDDFNEAFERVLTRIKFNLVILNSLVNVKGVNLLYDKAPILQDFKQNEIDEVRINTPVKDMWIDITIPNDTEDYKLLNYYNDYITTSLNIFGSFENIKKARLGNTDYNISSTQICNQIAQENGWNDHLDMSVELNVQIDSLYNPSNIKERASQTYEIIRNRANLLSDYEGKLDAILNIVKDNPNKKILIINKRGEFASKVTEYINSMSDTIICGNYHDKVEPIPAVDENGNPIFYKSGKNKGERKLMMAQAQKTLNQTLFNNGDLQILSTSSAPDKDLSINVDIIIITSPICDDIRSYLYRLSHLFFNANTAILYTLYIKGSLEQARLENKIVDENHTIVNKCEEHVVFDDNSNFILVD